MPRILPRTILGLIAAATGALSLTDSGGGPAAHPRSVPRRVPPLLGTPSVRAGVGYTRSGWPEAFAQRGLRSGTVTAVSLYVGGRTDADQIMVGVYRSRAGMPAAVLAVSSRVSPVRGRWNVLHLRSARLRAGTLYWLAILGIGGRLYYRYPVRSSCSSPRANRGGFQRLPRSWPAGPDTTTTCQPSAYVRGRPVVPPGGTTTVGPASRNCAGAPGSRTVDAAALTACGFPTMASTGPVAGTSLTNSSGFTASKPGAVYDGLNVSGAITVAADDVTIENSIITDDDLSNAAITIRPGVTGTRILHDSIHGSDNAGNALASGVENLYGPRLGSLVIDHTNFYNGDRILTGYGTVSNSYCLGGATFGTEHDECVYTSGGRPGISLIHDTLLNANPYQTAAVFVDSPDGSGSDGEGVVDIEQSLLGGGGYCLYGGEGSAGTHHTGPEAIIDNRFAALYFRRCGQFGPLAYMPADLVWSGNVWDSTGRPVAAP